MIDLIRDLIIAYTAEKHAVYVTLHKKTFMKDYATILNRLLLVTDDDYRTHTIDNPDQEWLFFGG